MDRYDPRGSGDDMVECNHGYFVKHTDAQAEIAELKELFTWAKKQVDKYLVEYDEREVQIAELKERIVLEKASHAQTYEFLSNVGADAIEKMVDDFVNRNIFCPVITRKAMKQYAQQLREQDNG